MKRICEFLLPINLCKLTMYECPKTKVQKLHKCPKDNVQDRKIRQIEKAVFDTTGESIKNGQ